MDKKTEFKPYIPAGKVTPENTFLSVFMGILLAVVFGAANAYLGLKVGMTVSASIPAAVIAMGVIRILLRRNSILESNAVQTAGSAGESLAAGAIFTLPVLFVWAAEGKLEAKPSVIEITLIALIGGLLGVFFMIPLRNALIVNEHGTLPYPEGTACAEVLLAGEMGGANASTVFAGMGLSALFKFIVDGLKVAKGEITLAIKGFPGAVGTQVYPALISVGYICGPRISSYMFAGSVLSWLALIPLIVLFGGNGVIYPSNVSVTELFANGGASAIWSTYIRYIGAGALAAGGLISLIKSLPLIIKAFGKAIADVTKSKKTSTERTAQDINMGVVIAVILVLTLLVWLVPAIPVNPIGAVIIVVFGFFFATVSARMVGLVGSSNNPVSGMAIATLLVATLILKFTGSTGINGMTSAIAIGSIICIVSAIAGDTSQDLKTGFLLGATPRKQQIAEVFGVVASALAIGGTLYLLDAAWGFGSKELAAPQASIMKIIVEGVMEGTLPWTLILAGAFIAIVIEILGIPVLPFAIGIYLPIHINACIMLGGIVRFAIDKLKRPEEEKKEITSNGILFCSGMIAGEGIVGILLAIITIFGIDKIINLEERLALSDLFTTIGGFVMLGIIIFTLISFALRKSKKQ